MLAHGGTAGAAAAETLFVLIPIAVFALLSRRARIQREREDAAAEAAEAGVDPETTGP